MEAVHEIVDVYNSDPIVSYGISSIHIISWNEAKLHNSIVLSLTTHLFQLQIKVTSNLRRATLADFFVKKMKVCQLSHHFLKKCYKQNIKTNTSYWEREF